MPEITDAEAKEMAAILTQEVTRLENLVRDYDQYKGRSRSQNTIMREMAEEGKATIQQRITRNKALAKRLDPPPAPTVIPR